VNSAQTYFKLEAERYETCINPYLAVLGAQTTVLGGQQTLNSLHVQQITDPVVLVEALSGGWDRSQLPGTWQVSEKPLKADTRIEPLDRY